MMKFNLILPAFILALFFQPAQACQLFDAAAAKKVLGTDVTNLSFDATDTCMFMSKDARAQLSVQTANREYYNRVSIMKPFDAIDIGDQARLHQSPKDGMAIQFVKGDVSVTLSVRIMRAADGSHDYLKPLKELAIAIADDLN